MVSFWLIKGFNCINFILLQLSCICNCIFKLLLIKQDKIDEEDEKLLEAFLSKDDRPQRTLADIIVEKIKEKDAQVSSGLRYYFSQIIRTQVILTVSFL